MTSRSSRIDELIRAAGKAREVGLVVATSGNISVRLDERTFAVSCSGRDLGELDRAGVAVCPTDGGGDGRGGKPSLETPLHRAIYRECPDVGAVLHFQSPFATAWACAAGGLPDLAFIPEVPAHLGTVETVGWHLPGSAELAEAVARRVRDPGCRVLLLRNHGQIASGRTLTEVLRSAEVLELACRVAATGIELRRFDPETVDRLRNYGS